MKTFPLLLILLFLGGHPAWAAKKKKQKPKKQTVVLTEGPIWVYEMPSLYDPNGGINMEFFNEMKDLTQKSNICDDDMDPRWKAKLYITHLKKLTHDMSLLLAVSAVDFSDEKLADMGIDLEFRIRQLEKPPGILDYASQVLPANQLAKATVDGINSLIKFNKKIDNAHDKKHIDSVDFKMQMSNIRNDRDALIEEFQDLRSRLEDIESALKGNEDDINNLSMHNQAILRATMCRFMEPESWTKKFCSDSPRNHDFTMLRGSATCKEVKAIDDDHRKAMARTIKATFAMGLAKKVIMKDNSGLMPSGTTSRFEVVLGKRKGKFFSPGGNQLLCTILNNPKYDIHWKKNPRRLKETLRISDMGFPLYVRVHKSKWVSSGDNRYQGTAHRSAMGRINWNVDYVKFGAYKTGLDNSGRAGDWMDKHHSEIDLKLTEVLGNECDRDD